MSPAPATLDTETPRLQRTQTRTLTAAILSEWRYPAITVMLMIAAFIFVNPVLESGMNDDWIYTYIAKGVAETGKLQYHGWAEPTIVPQALWAALLFKLFGFSF